MNHLKIIWLTFLLLPTTISANFVKNFRTAQRLQEKHHDQAWQIYQKAIEEYPGNEHYLQEFLVSLMNLGNHFFEHDPKKALEVFQAMVRIHENIPQVYHNIGFTLAEKFGRHEQALGAYDKALALKESIETHYCRAEALLALGNLEEGFKEYEFRWLRGDRKPRRSLPWPLPKQWNGQDLDNKRILIHVEQGMGDTIQFLRYSKNLKERGATVIVEVQKPLVDIAKSCPFVDKVVAYNTPMPAFDYQIPLMSLPRIMETTLETIPVQEPYLFANEQWIKFWQEKLRTDTNFKIGICWHGSHVHSEDKFMPLEYFMRLANIPEVSLYSLQQFDGVEQIEQLGNPKKLHVFSGDFDKSHGRFADTAAVMCNMDLIITVDTSIAHLAGALGVPTWVVLPFPAEWRWLHDRTDSPWYPTIKLFRQQERKSWKPVIETIANQLSLNLQQPQTLLNRACNCVINGSYQKGLELYQQVLTHFPDNISMQRSVALMLRKTKQSEKALALYREILIHNPNDIATRRGMASALLELGHYTTEAWEHHEYRWVNPPAYVKELKNYIEQHKNLKNKTVLIKTEYGLGDTLQFIRYAQELKKLGATVYVESQKPLVKLLSQCPYIDKVIPAGSPLPATDFKTLCMSLPLIFETTQETIPDKTPYLFADKKLTKEWQQKLATDKNFKIGLCWHADPHKNSNDMIVKLHGAEKSVPLKILAELSTLPNVSLYSLQKVDGLDQLIDLPPHVQVKTFDCFDEEHGPFMDTAAIMKNLDLMITVDTSVAHLAGGLGIPVWLLLPYSADWRWMLDRDDSPWYPTMQLFRQKYYNEWQPLINEIRFVIERFVKDL